MGERIIPRVNYDQLQIGTFYAIRAESGLDLRAGMYLGQVPKRLQDGRVVQGRAWALPSADGWWRPDWSWSLKMRWDDYLALPEGERPL